MSRLARSITLLLLMGTLFGVVPAHARTTEAEFSAYKSLRQLCAEHNFQAQKTWALLSATEQTLVIHQLLFEFNSFPEPLQGAGEPWPCLARLAGLFDIKAAAPYVQRWAESEEMLTMRQHPLNEVFVVARTLGKPVRDRALVQMITNTSSTLDAKRTAQVELVNLGTRRSARAWLDLRDAARAHPEAPKAKEQYTHREKIYETFLMYHKFIPEFFSDEIKVSRVPDAIVSFAVSVSEDFCAAELRVNYGGFESSFYRLCRNGDEWLIDEYGSTVIP